MYAVYPKPWCEHLQSVEPVPVRGIDVTEPCLECGHVGENWLCLVCYQVRSYQHLCRVHSYTRQLDSCAQMSTYV